MSRDVSVFDDCNLNNVKLYLTRVFVEPIMKSTASKWYSTCSHLPRKPFVIIDCSPQNEFIKNHCKYTHRILLQGECVRKYNSPCFII